MRKLAIVALGVVALIVIALLVVPRFLDVNRYRDRIQAELQQKLNRPVSIGKIHLSLLPPSFQVENAVIGEDPHFGTRPFASVQELGVGAKLGPLLHREIEISSITLKRPSIELIRDANGAWNFSTLGQNASATQPHPQPAPAQQRPFSLDNLKLEDGLVAVTDLQKHQSRAIYDHIDVTLKNFAPGKAFDISAAAHLPGHGTQTVDLKGTAGPINEATLITTPFNGTIKLAEVQIAGLQKFLNTQALANTDAVISGMTDVKNENGKLSSNGTLKIEKARIRGVDLGYAVSADYKITDDLTNDVIHIERGKMTLGDTPLDITGTVNTRATPALLDVRLMASNVSISDAARLAAAFGVAFNPNTKVAGKATADVYAKGAADKPQLAGTLSATDLVVSGQDLPQPVKVAAIQLALTPRDVRSNNFNLMTGSTQLNAQFALSQYTSASPVIDAALRTANANLTELLHMANAAGISAAQGLTGSGLLSLDVHAVGPVKNTSAMTFSGSGQLQNASLKPSDFRQPLVVHNANIKFSNNAAILQNVSATLGQTNANGAVTVRNFAAPNLQFTLSADKVNVVELQQITGNAPAQAPGKRAAARFWNVLPRAEAAPAAQPSLLASTTGWGTVNIGTVIYDQLVLSNVRSTVTLDHGLIRMAPLTANLYDGQENGSIIVDTRTTPMAVTVVSSLSKVKANNLISSVSSLKDTIYGLLAANANTRFNISDNSDITRSLNGALTLDLTNGRIAKLDLLNQLAAIGKVAGMRKSAQAVTDVAKLTGHFNIVNGLATTNDLQAQIAGGTLAATGTVNLPTKQLDLHVTTVMSKGFTQQAGGLGGIGGLMQTALANNKGELVIPVLITGSFDNPQVAPDAQKIAQMKLDNMLPTAGNPGQLTTGILGSILGRGGNAGGQAGQQGGVAGAVLGAIGGQKQQQQQQQPTSQQPGNQPTASPPQPRPNWQDALQGILGGKKQQQQQQPPPPQQPPPQ